MAAWKRGYQASAPACPCGREAAYDIITRRDGKIRGIIRNLCGACAGREADRLAVTNDAVEARAHAELVTR